MTSQTSQEFESFVPVYDAVPDQWEDAKPFFVEQLKKISDAVNVRDIGWLLDEELLNGQQMFPGVSSADTQQFRSVLRKVIDCSPLGAGLNTFVHGITVDANFSLLHMYAGASKGPPFLAEPIPNGVDTLSMDATNVYVTVAVPWTRCYVVIEYMQES